jgi:hypothetical protein
MRCPRSKSRRFAIAVALLALAVPAGAYFARLTVHFKAFFDLAAAPGGSTVIADIGQFEQQGPVSSFTVVPGSGGGELLVQGGGGPDEASLKAQFISPFDGQLLVITWQVESAQTDCSLVLKVEDDSDTGMIDVEFGANGTVSVDDTTVGFGYQVAQTYDCTMRLSNNAAGPATWIFELRWGAGNLVKETGTLNNGAPLVIESIELVLPAGSNPGQFLVDDLKAVSYDYKLN